MKTAQRWLGGIMATAYIVIFAIRVIEIEVPQREFFRANWEFPVIIGGSAVLWWVLHIALIAHARKERRQRP